MPAIKKTGQLSDLRSIDALVRFGTRLLREERDIILSGSYEKLVDMPERKEAFMLEVEARTASMTRERTLPERDVDRDALRGVLVIFVRRANENASLLASALRGVREGRGIVEGMDDAAHAGLYGAGGRKIPTAERPSTLSRL